MKNFINGIIFVFLLSIIGYCGTIDPNTPDAKYVEYGKDFHSVVKLCCFDGKNLFCGSAVVIHPHWIITAAHIVENCHSWTVTINEDKYHIKSMISHKEYENNKFGVADIAVGYLENPIILDYYPELYENDDEIGKLCSISGWGFTGTFNTGTKLHDGKRRAGSNFIDKTENSVLVCSPSKPDDSKTTQLEFLICSGDSGGGLFIGNKLAGINSSVIGYDGKSNSTYRDESCHTRISLYRKWILEIIEKGQDN